jgi:hypothetical protein
METVKDDDATEIDVITILSKYACSSPSIDTFTTAMQQAKGWPEHSSTSGTTDLSHLGRKLQFKLKAFELMALCSAGTSSNHVEGLLQKSLNCNDLLRLLSNPTTPLEIRSRIGALFFEAFVAVQVPVKALHEDGEGDELMWQWLGTLRHDLDDSTKQLPDVFRAMRNRPEGLLLGLKISQAFAIRMSVVYTFECILPTISHFVKLYLLPRNRPLSEERVLLMRELLVGCKKLERVCENKCAPVYLVVCLTEAITFLDRLLRRYSMTATSPDMFRKIMLRARKKLDSESVKTAQRTRKNMMKGIEENGHVSIIHRYSSDYSV